MKIPLQSYFARGVSLLALVSLCLALGPRLLEPAQTQETPRQPAAPVVNGPLVQQLAFLSGSWRGGVAGGLFDEEWSSPSASSMMGMFRYSENGQVKLYEFMAIEASSAGPVLRLRHFDPGLAAGEDKDAPVSLPVSSFSENQVIFESPDKSTRLTYRSGSPDSLTVVLERVAAGHKGRQEFNFTRVP